MVDNARPPVYTLHNENTTYTVPEQPSFANPPLQKSRRFKSLAPPAVPFLPTLLTQNQRRTQNALQLVTQTQLKGHLTLLYAFHAFKTSVQDGDDRFPATPQMLDGQRRWSWFIALAVERYVYA